MAKLYHQNILPPAAPHPLAVGSPHDLLFPQLTNATVVKYPKIYAARILPPYPRVAFLN